MELFISICDSRKVPSKISNEWLENVKRQYSAENRHFHNVALIEKKLKLAREIAGDDGFNDALVFAILFQYFNYDVKRDLKKENCDAFRLFIDQAGVGDEHLVTKVLAMLQDESVQAPEASPSIDLFNDLDLAVLGSSPDEYADYLKSLQQEYATETFNKDRLKMLKTLLMIPNIYNNPKMRERFESTARQNIQSEINDLQA